MKYVFILVLAAIVFIALYNDLVMRRYVVKSKKIKSDVKIVLISDVHSMRFGQNKLIRLTKKVNPNIIILAGDIFDAKRKTKYADEFLEKLPKNISTFYVTGNHEHKNERISEYMDILKKYEHIKVLDGTKKFIKSENSICVCGISDPMKRVKDDVCYNYKSVIANNFSNIGDSYNILIAHSPFYVKDYLQGDFDLVLSGHTHGGQVRIPILLNGLFNRSWGFFPPYCGGKYIHENGMVHIVSRGAANNPWWCPRVFNRREIVCVTLKKD